MTRSSRLAAMPAALFCMALAAGACSPKAPAPDQAAATNAPTPALATAAPTGQTPLTDASGLPAACQSLLALMQSCSDNLTRQGSPLGNQIRLSMTDMRTSIAAAPPADASSFCDTEAGAFRLRAQASHC